MAEPIKAIETPKDFEYQVMLYSDRVNPDVNSWLNITDIVTQFEIFENINIPFLTARLAIVDTNNLEKDYQFKGTENLLIDVKLPGNSLPLQKRFIIMSVDKKFKTNDNTTVLSFNLLEHHSFIDNITQISKMYDGKPETIIQKIIEDNFNIEVDVQAKESYQPRQRYIIPYLNPLKATRKVLDKTSTENGLPYYLFSTLISDKLILKDLETMISEEPFNINNPFRFAQAYSEISSTDPIMQILNIESIKEAEQSDTLILSQMGVLGSSYTLFDIQSGKTDNIHFNLLGAYESLNFKNILPADQREIPLDRKFVPNSEGESQDTLDTYDSRNFFRIGAQTYSYEKGVYTFGQNEISAANYASELTANAFKQMMYHNEIKIRVAGLPFLLKEGVACGNTIKISVPPNTNEEEQIHKEDPQKSGVFVIAARRHVFDTLNNTSVVDLTATRITELDNV